MQRTLGSSALAKILAADYSEALDRLAARDVRHGPLVTYRLQFSSRFRFVDALQLVDYFSALGVSHLYSSPIFNARAGSLHGYDITEHNPWWQDVLANGRSSRFADYFDIDWCPLKPELENKVLLPVLGLQYGQELESG